MNLDDGYETDPTYGPPGGVSRHEGTPLMRQFVQRYLKLQAEGSSWGGGTAAASTLGVAPQAKRDQPWATVDRTGSMAEQTTVRLTQETVGVRLEQKLDHLAMLVDRMMKDSDAGEALGVLDLAQGSQEKNREAMDLGSLRPAQSITTQTSTPTSPCGKQARSGRATPKAGTAASRPRTPPRGNASKR